MLAIIGFLFFVVAFVLFAMLAHERVRYFHSGARVHVFNQMLYLLGCVASIMVGVGVFGFRERKGV